MRRRVIPGTHLEPSVIALGTVSFGSTMAAGDAFRMLDLFLELGGTFIDTAHIYADWATSERSMSEKTIGAWLAQTGARDHIVLATKGAHTDRETKQKRVRPDEIRTDLAESLEYLQTDHIDLYWLHRDDPEVPVRELIDCLEDLRLSGAIGSYGCSNWSPARIQEAALYAASRNVQGFVANQLMWSLATPNPGSVSDPTLVSMDRSGYAYHKESGLAAVAYSSQAKGFFSGKYAPDKTDEGEGRRQGVIRQYYNPANFARLEQARAIGDRLGCSANEVALAYLIHQPFPTFPIVGPRSLEQLRASCAGAEVSLTPADLAALEGASS